MPDPVTIAAAAAGKEVAKKADPYFALLLKPSFELVGKELKTLLKEKIDEWKKQRREENLIRHIERTKKILDEEPSKECARDNIKNVEAFASWADGAQDIDPEDETLASMWQRILADMVQGNDVQQVLIEKLKGISSAEAQALLRFRRHRSRYPEDDEDRHHLLALAERDIVTVNYAHLIKIGIVAAAALLFLSAFFSAATARHNAYLALIASDPYNTYRRSSYDFEASDLFKMMYSWQFLLAGTVVFLSPFIFKFYNRGFTRWQLTWIGQRLIRYATAKRA